MSAADAGDRAPDPEQVWKTLSLVNEWIRHGDAKLGLTLAADGVLAAVLYNLLDGTDHGCLGTACALAAGLAILASSVCAVVGLLPQLKPPGKSEDYSSLIYYRHIARGWVGRRTQYTHQLLTMTTDAQDLSAQLADQVYWNSAVADRKFVWATRAVVATVIAMAFTAGLAVIRLLLA